MKAVSRPSRRRLDLNKKGRKKRRKNNEEEEDQENKLDGGSDTAVGIGLEPTSDGPSVEFSSVSSSEESGPTEDPDKNGSSRRMRLQLRAVFPDSRTRLNMSPID